MRDVLSAMTTFPFMKPNIAAVHLVEASPYLRKLQASSLAPGCEVSTATIDGTTVSLPTVTTVQGIKVHWHDDLDTVPKSSHYVVTHEFFDALPVFSFEV
jgi:NADH dehydrogenase [ubiquinone] 1 alpha subcomplex assembly factor 7